MIRKKITQLRWDPKAIKHCFVGKMYRFPEKPEGGAGSPGVDGTGLGGENRTWVLCKSKCCSPMSCLCRSPPPPMHGYSHAKKKARGRNSTGKQSHVRMEIHRNKEC